MPIELNQFTANVDNSQLVLSDNASGDPVIVKSQFSFAEKVMQWLTQIPLLSDLSAVQEFVQKQTEGNLKTLGVFLSALAHEYGDEFAGKVANKMDFSGQTPLTSRLVKQLTQGSVSVEKKEPQLVQRDNRQIQADSKAVEDSRLPTSTPMSKLEQAAKSITGYLCPAPLPSPSSLSYMSSFFYSETATMQRLQKEVSAYNQAIKTSTLDDEAHKLAQIFQKPLPSETVTVSIETFSAKVDKLKENLANVESAIDQLANDQQNDVKQLKRVMFKENDRLDAIKSLANLYRQAWQSESEDYKAFSTFYETCSPALKSTLTPELARLSFELINNSPSLDSETLANRLSDKLVQYASDMSTVNLRVLSEVLAEKVPSLADDVFMPFPKKEQKAQLGAINLIKQALKQSRTELMEEQKGIEARLDIPSKINQLRHSAAVFAKEMQQFFESDSTVEDQFSATLAALTGNVWLVVKGDNLLPDELTDYDDLDLTDQIRNELDQIHISDKTRKLAEDVIQAQHRLSWLDRENSVTHERNNRAGVNIYADIESKQLADNITQNLTLYADYLDEKVSAAKAYVASLDALAQETISDGVTKQLIIMRSEAERQLTRLTNLAEQCGTVQMAQDTKVLLGNKLARLDTMLDRTVDANTKRLNLQGFLSFLSPLRANNDQVRALILEREELQLELNKQEKYVVDLHGKNWRNQPHISSEKEVETLKRLELSMASLVQDIELLDDEYEKSMLELTRFDREVTKEKGYPGVSGNSLESWSAWVKQNLAGHWSGDYRPDLSTLILERQMAKVGIQSYTEAYQKLYATLSSGEVSSNYQGVMNTLGQLHNWAMAHPVESQALAGNLTHAYQIISSNSGWFGNDLAAMASTVWKTGSVENQVKDILQGRREFLPSHESMSMTAEMIALIHLAQCAPYIAGAVKGASGSGVVATGASQLVAALVPGAPLMKPMASMIGGLVQTWSERKMANVVNRNRSTEIMVNALMAGIHKQGSFNDRAKAIASYAMQRQALQDIGTLSRDCFETNKAGAMSRMWQDAKNTWQEMNWKAKSFTVATTAAVSIGAAAIAALSMIAIVGTGGIAIAIAAIAGAGVTPLGALLARTALNLIASTNFLGMNDAHNRAKENMTQQRIDEALQRLANKTKDDQRLGDLLGDSLNDAGQLIQLNHLPEDQQETSFRYQIASIASEREQQVIEQNTLSKAKLIETAKSYVPESLLKDENGSIDWENCYQQVEQALVKQAA
ncbi:type III secretion system effector BopA family protein [Vibrio neptunius]|uniref:type III secretion system effector BopA family protein n=1 Tax=Vibrio neptunius TaxID=170651 RepID=UPI0039E8FD38